VVVIPSGPTVALAVGVSVELVGLFVGDGIAVQAWGLADQTYVGAPVLNYQTVSGTTGCDLMSGH
jgi:xanthosine utilization system XapX-like protein